MTAFHLFYFISLHCAQSKARIFCSQDCWIYMSIKRLTISIKMLGVCLKIRCQWKLRAHGRQATAKQTTHKFLIDVRKSAKCRCCSYCMLPFDRLAPHSNNSSSAYNVMRRVCEITQQLWQISIQVDWQPHLLDHCNPRHLVRLRKFQFLECDRALDAMYRHLGYVMHATMLSPTAICLYSFWLILTAHKRNDCFHFHFHLHYWR